MHLNLIIDYDIKSDIFCFDTDIKTERLKNIVVDFLRTQIGKGKDESPHEDHCLYQIDITLDLADDIFYVTHNCGNKGLREGILQHFLHRLATISTTEDA